MLKTISTMAALLLVAQAGLSAALAGQARDEAGRYSYRIATEQCDAQKEAEAEEAEQPEVAENKPLGPEPRYFGF